MIKAIETIYKGYRFRSRLEARWAVFFDALKIPYKYELEGFNLEGKWYLPDFWLPEQEYWIEIKGQEPTEEEIDKATLLSIYTKKPTFLFWGDAWLPTKETHSAITSHEFLILGECANHNEAISKVHDIVEASIRDNADYWSGDGDCLYDSGEFSFCHALHDVPPHIEALFYQLSKEEVSLRTKSGKLYVDAPIGNPSRRNIEYIKTHEKELIDLLSSCRDGWIWGVQDIFVPCSRFWCECPMCHKLWICPAGSIHFAPCKCVASKPLEDCYTYNSPRLMAAYTAARQARFEHGEKP